MLQTPLFSKSREKISISLLLLSLRLEMKDCRQKTVSCEGHGMRCVVREIEAKTQVNWLKAFGYLGDGSTDAESLIGEAAMTNGIMQMQRFAGLRPTGIIDDHTKRLMESPRCGLPDILGGRKKRYARESTGWRKTPLSVFIGNWIGELGEERTKAIIATALRAWESYSNLKFVSSEVSDADIVLGFAMGHHGDRYPFDGVGGVLAHAYYPYEEGSYGGDVHFDAIENWTDSDKDDGVDFYTVAVHEIGHSLGLPHFPDRSSVMYPYYLEKKTPGFLGYADIMAMYDIYVRNPPVQEETITTESASETEVMPTEDCESCDGEGVMTTTPTTYTESDFPVEGVDDVFTTATIADTPDATADFTAVTTASIPREEETRGGYEGTFVGDFETVDEHLGHEEGFQEKVCTETWSNISILRGEIFIFIGSFLWRYSARGEIQDGYPVSVSQLFSGFPKNQAVDAALETPQGEIILLSGSKFWSEKDGHFHGPHNLSTLGLPLEVTKVDAAFTWIKNGKTYVFSQMKYWRYSEAMEVPDEGYPRDASSWRGVPFPINGVISIPTVVSRLQAIRPSRERLDLGFLSIPFCVLLGSVLGSTLFHYIIEISTLKKVCLFGNDITLHDIRLLLVPKKLVIASP
ncbi:unnamed protein product [Darwinula stevensoni]|uniref:Peptidase metallopeptidase domain-containing protein n=1 Tax=Darwinula stevensoni TaxID=69355 RepID=A0A7R9A740_9CRUS|nr:unnamed protein product [Darwinula stevensoni]CAG0891397.1 unnamed protein product [Darwinula stevensoni]